MYIFRTFQSVEYNLCLFKMYVGIILAICRHERKPVMERNNLSQYDYRLHVHNNCWAGQFNFLKSLQRKGKKFTFNWIERTRAVDGASSQIEIASFLLGDLQAKISCTTGTRSVRSYLKIFPTIYQRQITLNNIIDGRVRGRRSEDHTNDLLLVLNSSSKRRTRTTIDSPIIEVHFVEAQRSRVPLGGFVEVKAVLFWNFFLMKKNNFWDVFLDCLYCRGAAAALWTFIR